ncbi:MAG TPA: alpha/beta hydrolase [Bacillales bacterium]|nr:alpha/beta hydrolase [Bacillales bacterium]
MTKWLFLHGAGGSKSKWRRVKPYFKDWPAEFVDLPGHGGNSDSVPTSIEEYAEIVGKTIDEDVIVVGHSMGGLIGIELASQNHHVKGLVLAASHYRLPVHQGFLDQLENGEYPDKFFYAAYGKETGPALLTEEKKEHDSLSVETAFADFSSCNAYNGKTDVSQLRIPVLAVYGAEDRMIPPGSKDKLLAANADIQAATIEGAGHYVILEKPEAFAEAIRKWG